MTPTYADAEYQRLQKRAGILHDIWREAVEDERIAWRYRDEIEELHWIEERLEEMDKIECDREERDLLNEEGLR